MERAELFVDGDGVFALLGEDLAVGDVEYVVIDDDFRARWPGLSQREFEWRRRGSREARGSPGAATLVRVAAANDMEL